MMAKTKSYETNNQILNPIKTIQQSDTELKVFKELKPPQNFEAVFLLEMFQRLNTFNGFKRLEG